MALGNKLRFIRSVLYRLKRDYGFQVDLYHQDSESIDFTTGRETVQKTEITVKRAILLPTSIANNLFKVLNMATNFQYGGAKSLDTRDIIIDRRDLGSFVLDDYQNIYIIIANRRYEITKYIELDYSAAYYITLAATEGAQPAQAVPITIKDRIVVNSEGTVNG